jgi:NACHT domain
MTSYTAVWNSTTNNVGRNQYNITNITYSSYNNTALDQTLQKLEPACMDGSMRSECLKGTRVDVLQSIINWHSNTSVDQRVLWLHGLAGTGKSTLATTIANIFRERGRLGAFVFFNRDIRERSQPSNIIRTIAHQLGAFDTRIGNAIAVAIDNMPSIVLSPLRLQFEKLVLEPLSTLPLTEPPIALVLDALDECGTAEDRKYFLALLAAQPCRLPSFVRLIITSRDEFDIRAAFITRQHILIQHLIISSDHNSQDILTFLSAQMAEIRLVNASLSLPPD